MPILTYHALDRQGQPLVMEQLTLDEALDLVEAHLGGDTTPVALEVFGRRFETAMILALLDGRPAQERQRHDSCRPLLSTSYPLLEESMCPHASSLTRHDQLLELHQHSVQLRAELAALPSGHYRCSAIIAALRGIHRRYARLAGIAADQPQPLLARELGG